MNNIHWLPYSMASSFASASLDKTSYGDKIVYFGKVYTAVSLSSPVFKHPLFEEEKEEDEDHDDVDKKISDEPPLPIKLIRLQHPRFITLPLYKKNGEIVSSNRDVCLSGYVPYEWLPVLFEHNNEIKWYSRM